VIRIALDATALGSARGGDETYMRSIVDGLARVAEPDERYRLYVREEARVDTAGFEVERLRVGGGVRLVTELPVRLRRARRETDLYVGYTHLPMPAPSASALVLTDLSFVHHPEHYPRGARLRLTTLAPRQARRARAVITLSEFCRRDMIEHYGLDEARVHVVPCAVERPRDLSDEERGRAALWLKREGVDRPYVLYLGNLHPRKNLTRLIHAFARADLDGLQLVVAGASWWKGSGEEDAAREAAEGSVVLVGRVDDLQRAFLLESAHALVYPSLFEGFGLPPLEAMAVGTPVVAANAAAIPEVCGDAALLVDPTSIDAIAAGLVSVSTDDAERRRLREAGRTRAALFDVERTGRAARAAFEHALTA
jgi:glycosyltransferase involved in cell wall biosynthesis